jgi:hypothetical protein
MVVDMGFAVVFLDEILVRGMAVIEMRVVVLVRMASGQVSPLFGWPQVMRHVHVVMVMHCGAVSMFLDHRDTS